MANEDSTPGIWQNERWTIVLAHVTHCIWSLGSASASREHADHLVIHFSDGGMLELYATDATGPEARTAARLEMGDSFVRALNQYWETKR
jgi:hypothetical protein